MRGLPLALETKRLLRQKDYLQYIKYLYSIKEKPVSPT